MLKMPPQIIKTDKMQRRREGNREVVRHLRAETVKGAGLRSFDFTLRVSIIKWVYL